MRVTHSLLCVLVCVPLSMCSAVLCLCAVVLLPLAVPPSLCCCFACLRVCGGVEQGLPRLGHVAIVLPTRSPSLVLLCCAAHLALAMRAFSSRDARQGRSHPFL